jgi:hypothetical protein
MTQGRAHDCLVNVHFGDADQPEWMYRVKNEYFKKGDDIFKKADMSAILGEMDAQGVERDALHGLSDQIRRSATGSLLPGDRRLQPVAADALAKGARGAC